MSSEKEYMAADLRGPLNTWFSTATGVATGATAMPREQPLPACQIVALVVASGISTQFDLSQSGYFGSNHYQEKFVRMISESAGDMYYAWAQVTGTSITGAATAGQTGVAAFLPSRTYTDELPAGRFLTLQGTSSGVFRIWITNRIS
jgi:hypothetical protein